MKKYRCLKCGYKEKKDFFPSQCNYCSEKNCMKEIEDAPEILKSIN